MYIYLIYSPKTMQTHFNIIVRYFFLYGNFCKRIKEAFARSSLTLTLSNPHTRSIYRKEHSTFIIIRIRSEKKNKYTHVCVT